MYQSLIISLLAATALAAPSPLSPRDGHCTTPGTYTCSSDSSTIDVCDLDYNLKPLFPGCPAGTSCQPNPFGNYIPYCMLKYTKRATYAKRNESTEIEDGGDDDSSASSTPALPSTTTASGANSSATGGSGAATDAAPTSTGGAVASKTAGSGYATYPPVATGSTGSGTCSVPNQFWCFIDPYTGRHGIRICDLLGQVQTVGYCAATEHCGNIGAIPYCLASWA